MLVSLNQINIGLSHFYQLQGGQLSTNRDRLCTSKSKGNAREEMVPFKMSIEFALSVYLSKNYNVSMHKSEENEQQSNKTLLCIFVVYILSHFAVCNS